MADINNFSEINDNFNTIKTLLNSIRAQGILNTSDMDKLLEGINSKLEKIDTQEDIDAIKSFLSELKNKLEERHEVVLSKFGAIESLFSNLLKNSNETVKSNELKELFDIIATNLSVFSREVVSQKEALGDITLRLDAMRSDDSQKKDIIKSVTTVRNDIEKLSNGFDSIVISLNENFKTVLKTISEVDQSEAISGFAGKLNDILDSSNAVLSAIQLIDKKNNQQEEAFDNLATHDDTANIQRGIIELSAKSKEIGDIVDTIVQKSYKLDNLADKIDASVNIIAGLKADIAEKDDSSKNAILDKLTDLENTVKEVSSNKDFNEFKQSLETVFKDITRDSEGLKESFDEALASIEKINEDIKSLDISTGFNNVTSQVISTGEDVKEKVASETDKITQLLDVNITRTLENISSNAEALNSGLKESHTQIAGICEKNFSEVTENITDLKGIVAQLDENNVAANNAIFSNITDRLAMFENSLKSSLEKQEDFVSNSSSNVIEQILNIKKIAEEADYKLDSSSIEILNSKKEFADLKTSVDNMLALDFVNTVKDLKVDMFAVKQDLADAIDNVHGELSEKLANDLFGKYELLISKLDTVEDELKYAQTEALDGLKSTLDNISSSIVDILSYVSVQKAANSEALEAKLTEVTENLKDSNLNYVENVRDVVDVIRAQVENSLKQLGADSDVRFSKITSAISDGNASVKQDIKQAYGRIEEICGNFDALKEQLNLNSLTMTSNVTDILTASDNIRTDFETKLASLKNALLDKVTEFKKEFTCENTDNISEIKFSAENLNSKVIEHSEGIKEEIKTELKGIIEAFRNNISSLNEIIAGTTLKMEGANKEVIDYIRNDFAGEVNNSVDSIKTNTADVLNEIDVKVTDAISCFSTLSTSVNNLTTDTKNALQGTLAKILENFVALQAYIKTLDEQSEENSNKTAISLKADFAELKENFNNMNLMADGHLKKQTEIIDKNYTQLENILNKIDTDTKQEFKNAVQELTSDFHAVKKKITEVDNAVDEDLARQVSIIEGSFESLNLMLVDIMNQTRDALGDKIKQELSGVSDRMSESLAEELEQYKTQIEDLYEELKNQNGEQSDFIKQKALELSNILETTIERQNGEAEDRLKNIAQELNSVLNQNIELTSADYSSLKSKIDEFYNNILLKNTEMVDAIKTQLDDIAKFVNTNLDIQNNEVNTKFNNIISDVENVNADIRNFKDELSPKLELINSSIENLKTETIGNAAEGIINNLSGKMQTLSEESVETTAAKIEEIKAKLNNLHNNLNSNVEQLQSSLKYLKEENSQERIKKADELAGNITAVIKDFSEGNFDAVALKIDETKQLLENNSGILTSAVTDKAERIINEILSLQTSQTDSNNKLQQILEEDIKSVLNSLRDSLNLNIEQLKSSINGFKEENIQERIKKADELTGNLTAAIKDLTEGNFDAVALKIDEIKQLLENNSDLLTTTVSSQIGEILEEVISLQAAQTELNNKLQKVFNEDMKAELNNLNNSLVSNVGQIKSSIKELKEENSQERIKKADELIERLTSVVKSFYDGNSDAVIQKTEEIGQLLENNSGLLTTTFTNKAGEILGEIISLQTSQTEQNNKLQKIFEEDIKTELNTLNDSLQGMFEQNSVNFITHLGNTNTQLSETISSGISEFKNAFDNLNERLDKDDLSRMNVYQAQLKDLNQTFNQLTEQSKELVKSEISSILDKLTAANTEISAGELQTIEAFANKILEQQESIKQNSIVCKDLITKLVEEHFGEMTENIQQQSDIIVGDVLEQFGLLKDAQKDEIADLTASIESSVAGYVIDAVNDLKSYTDVRTDSSVINEKLDNLKIALEKSVESTAENITKLLSKSVLTDSIKDLKATNEVLLESMTDDLNTKLQDFIKENVSKKFDDKLNVFNKNFTDTIVDKYEEVKVISTQYNKAFEKISGSVEDLLSQFVNSKEDINNRLQTLVGGINKSIDDLKYGFADLKAQILNKSFDEAFHDSVHNQIAGIENLVKEQMGYLEDINELCGSNLPELTEMSTLVKYSIQKDISDVKEQISTQTADVPKVLNQLKTDIITQFINVFNQISFVSEQEEITNFIQEKHSELITILSHIVTTTGDIETVKDNVAVVDNKIDSLKEDIGLINEKITSIMSSDGSVDYVYSLQDLESDIANLRIILNDMKADNKSKEFEELISSTNNIYKLVETIKTEMPTFEAEEFKKDFNALSEDIVSISTRTNKLLLSSDESNKTLQDNLHDFKLVIDDLDERTRNFAREAGIEKIDNKLATLNTMMQNGAKTNQVFNQVFEYLAEWVDKAGTQISSISDKVETLDDIGQIKVMLEDLRAQSQDDSESTELVEALTSVFDKQAKRIASLEAKVDRLIVDATINSKSDKLDLTPFENTLNRFLSVMDDKLSSQQTKINSLEEKLEEVVSLADNKDSTAELTKKVGGMDKRLAKLNKSIEKIASNVAEK